MDAIKQIIDLAKNYTGYLEKASNENLSSLTVNAGSKNYTKFAKDYAVVMDVNLQGQPWCAVYISMLYVELFGADKAKQALCGNLYASCTMAVNAFKKQNRFYTTPQSGDLIIFKDSSGPCHIGIVTNVNNSTVYTNEGNTNGGNTVIPNGGGVYNKNYLLNNNRIYGYLRPDYTTLIDNKPEWIKENNNWRYMHTDGSFSKAAWEQVDSKWYYFDKDGWMQTGWVAWKNKWYYCQKDGSMVSDMVLKLTHPVKGLEKYSFAVDGHMETTNDRGSLV